MSKDTGATRLDDGGPAFPLDVNSEVSGNTNYGMSLRDWFAGQVLPHAASRARYLLDRHGEKSAASHAPAAAALAFEIADAMLAERAKEAK